MNIWAGPKSEMRDKIKMRDKSSPTVNTSEIKYQKLAYSHTQKNCTKNLLLWQLKCTKYISDTLKKHTQQTQLLAI